MSVVASRFRAMNTDIALLSPHSGPHFEKAASLVRHAFWDVERCLSRFRVNSELCALNGAAGTPFRASPLLFEAVSLALRAAFSTDGVFDPTILPALEYAGYDQSFELMGASTGVPQRASPQTPTPDYRSIHCRSATRTITLAAGQRIDLGGIGKGLAVDRAIEATSFLHDRCVAAGGDVAARGDAEPEQGWSIAIEDTGNEESRPISIRDEAVATSSTRKRRWQADGEEQHHLIDTRTGRPSLSPLRSVTVVMSTCVQADVAAKTALLLGEEGMTFLERQGIHGFAVDRDGRTMRTSKWPRPGAGT
ncbi:MAG: hypothetical protein NVSMB52_14450 [Chloroflexota bacterium]